MRSKVTFILLALNLVLFGYLLVSEHPWSKTQTIEDNRHRVLGPEAANLGSLEITTYAAPTEGAAAKTPTSTLHLKRVGKTWLLTDPLDWPANENAVQPMLTALQFLEDETRFPVAELEQNGQTLADFGLAHPRLVVTATPAATSPDAPAPAPFTLRIGDGTAVGQNLYVLSPDGRRIHVVGPALLEALGLGLNQLRSDLLFTIPVFESRALTLQTAAASSARTRLRHEQTDWVFENPITTRAAKTDVELLINELNSLRVARFLPPDPDRPPEQTGLATPRLRITLEGNSRRETLVLGLPVSPPAKDAATTTFYARLDERPTLFTVEIPNDVLRTLDTAQTALRDRHLLDFDPARVTAITLAPPGGTPLDPLRIQKLDPTATGPADWQFSTTALIAPRRADPALVARLLQNLQYLQAEPPRPDASPFVSDAPSKIDLENLGFNRPERTVTLQLAPAEPTAAGGPLAKPESIILELGQGPGGASPGLYARVQGQPFIYAVPPATLYLFDVAPLSWRDRSLARLPAATKITRLVLRSTATPDAPALLDYSPSATPPSPAVATLLDGLRELRAKSIVREDYPATIPVDGVEKPWAYTLEATLDPAAGGPLVLSLGQRAGGRTQLAGSAQLGLVFTLEQPVLDALWSILYPETKPQAPNVTRAP